MIVAAASSSLQFVPLPNVNARDMLPLPNGNVVVFGVITASGCTVVSPGSCDQTEFPLLSVIDASGTQKAILPRSALGSGNSSLAAASIDASGNIWITGQTDSDDFPLVRPLFFQKADYHAIGFVAKLDANLNILFSTFLGGQPALGPSNPTNIGLDSSGNAYVVGNTEDTAFPTTGSGFGVGAPSSNPLNPQTYTFVLKISSDGSRLLYSRLLGGNGSPCTGGSACIGYAVYTIPSAIVVNANGSLTVAGATNATNFPITANAYQTVGGAFITRISADGAQLIWSTEVGIATQFLGLRFFSSVQSIALDAADDVYVAGSSGGSIATTPNALQSTVALSVYPAVLNGFAIELSSDATQLLYATNLGGTNGASLTG